MSHNTKSNQRSNMRTRKQNTMKSKNVLVPANLVGPTIGPKGETVLGLARSAGKGVRIQHQRDQPGTFLITAWDSSALLRAEIKLKEHIQKLEADRKKKHSRQGRAPRTNTTQSGSRFQALGEDASQSGSQPRSTKPNPTAEAEVLDSVFTFAGTIGKRKEDKWLQHHAKEPEKEAYFKRLRAQGKLSNPTTTKEQVPTASDFPALASQTTRPTLVTSIWSSQPDEVRTEKAKTPPPTPPSSLKTLVPGEVHEPEEPELDYAPIKRVVEEQEEGVTQGDEGAFSTEADEEQFLAELREQEQQAEQEEEEEEEDWENWDEELELVSGNWADEDF